MLFSVTILAASLFGTTVAAAASSCPSSAHADCVSYFKKTVSSCIATSTSYTMVTVTASPSTSTSYLTQTSNSALTQTLSISYTSTSTDLQTVFTTQDVTSVSTSSAQVTSFVTLTSTVSTSQINGPAKRAESTSCPLVIVTLSDLSKRSIPSTCSTTIISPSRVPSYASACSGTARYSSACSCNGATQSTTTLLRQTTTVTETSTATTTPTVQVTITQVVSVTSTNTVTNSQLVVSSQTLVTTIQVTSTDLETSIVASTLTSTATATNVVGPMSGFFITSIGNGQYVNYDQGEAAYPLISSSFISVGLQLNQYGQLLASGTTGYIANAAGTGNDQIYLSTPNGPSVDIPNSQRLYCTLTNFARGSGSLYCSVGQFGGAQSVFNLCGNKLKISTSAQVACTVVTLSAQSY